MKTLGIAWGDQREACYVIECWLRDEAEREELVAALRLFARITPSVEGEMLGRAWCQAHGLGAHVGGRSAGGWEIASGLDAEWLTLPGPSEPPTGLARLFIRSSYAAFVPGALAEWLRKRGGTARLHFGQPRAKSKGRARPSITVRCWCDEPARSELKALVTKVGEPFGKTIALVEGKGPEGEVLASVESAEIEQAARALAEALTPRTDLTLINVHGVDAAWRAFAIEQLISIEPV